VLYIYQSPNGLVTTTAPPTGPGGSPEGSVPGTAQATWRLVGSHDSTTGAQTGTPPPNQTVTAASTNNTLGTAPGIAVPTAPSPVSQVVPASNVTGPVTVGNVTYIPDPTAPAVAPASVATPPQSVAPGVVKGEVINPGAQPVAAPAAVQGRGSAMTPFDISPWYLTQNPNAVEQAAQWQQERVAAGEDPNDWEAFRQHVTTISGSDPGVAGYMGPSNGPSAGPAGGAPAGSKPNPAPLPGNQPPATNRSATPFAISDWYKGQNPNAEQQAAEWQAARLANGEDPNDWEAFRAHVTTISGADPGVAGYQGPSAGAPAGAPTGPVTGGATTTLPGGGTVPTQGAAPGAAAGTTAGTMAGTAALNVRSLDDIVKSMAGGTNFGGLSDVEGRTYLPFGTQAGNALAGRNISRILGYNPDTGNPFSDFLQGNIADNAKLQGDILTAGGSAADPRTIAGAIAGTLGGGNYSPFGTSGAAANDFLNKVLGQQTSYVGGAKAGLTDAQQKLAQSLVDNPATAYDLFQGAHAGELSPFLANNKALGNRVLQHLLDQWNNQGPQNKGSGTFLGSLLGV